jgi:hypothetical protein
MSLAVPVRHRCAYKHATTAATACCSCKNEPAQVTFFVILTFVVLNVVVIAGIAGKCSAHKEALAPSTACGGDKNQPA